MERSEKTRKLLISHYQTYPQLQIQDIFKYLYQSSFGCEHMVSSFDDAVERIYSEISDNTIHQNEKILIDNLDGEYSRVHLAYLNYDLSAQTLGKLFLASAKAEPSGMKNLILKLETAKELADENLFNFTSNEFKAAIEEWRSNGYSPVHHSNIFRTLYRPAYRVIANRYVTFMPLFAKIDTLLKKGSAVIAVEGGSASGKTTLSKLLSDIYECTVFHMDDFFLRPEQRTAQRYAQPGGNIDWERFLDEVLVPLKNKEPISYRRFDCSSMKVASAVEVIPKKLTVIEGAYSMHPELAGYYDFSVFLDISSDLQTDRIRKRNSPEIAERFYNEWVPLEREYFSRLDVKDRCDLSFKV